MCPGRDDIALEFKATDIAKNCGFGAIDRIEQGMHVVVSGSITDAEQVLLNG